MKRATKRVVGWGAGVGIGVVFVVLTFVLITAVNSGAKQGLEGQDVMDVVEVAPNADAAIKADDHAH